MPVAGGCGMTRKLGRRAWRQWWSRRCTKQRKKGRDLDGRVVTPLHSAQEWRKRLGRSQPIDFGPVEGRPAPLTPAMLVGMTMGARKRAARQDAMGVRTAVHDFRTSLRIGQKLRPCPGCNMCGDTCGACEDLCPDDTKCLQCGRVMYSAVICDSSGVLPARKDKR